MRGTDPEPFAAEVLGVLPGALPHVDLIVARLSGLGLERSGVMAGMSGSPVYVDGRLLGAVAYRLVDFGHEAIAGIVPAEPILAVRALEQARAAAQPAAVPPRPAVAELLARAAALVTGEADGLSPGPGPTWAAAAAGIVPIATPVAFSGVRPRLVGALAPLLASLGWTPVSGGAAGTGASVTGAGGQIGPGGAIAVQLMRGDINVTASGTVTARDGDWVWAFGHPFLQGGAVDFPMVGAEVVTVLSSAAASRKLSVAGGELLGSFRQDRQTAILGRIGRQPTLVPVTMSLRRQGRSERLSYEIVADPILTPLYLFVGLVNGVQSLDEVYGESSIELDALLQFDDGRAARIGDLYASNNQAIVAIASQLAGLFSMLYDNAFEPVGVAGVRVDLGIRRDRRVADVESVWVDATRVRPGEEVRVAVTLRPRRAQPFVQSFDVRIPRQAAAGRLDLVVGDAESAAREEFGGSRPRPRDLDGLLEQLARRRRNDRLYVQLSGAVAGAVVAGEPLPSLPPSLLEVLTDSGARGDVTPLSRALLGEIELPVGYVVSGMQRIVLEVQER